MLLIATIAGALLTAGIITLIAGLRRRPVTPRRVRPGRHRSKIRTVAVGGVIVGAVIAVVSGWLVSILLVPVAAVVGWKTWRGRSRPRVPRLEALAEFARGLAGVLGVGRGIEEAIIQAAKSAPAALNTEVTKLAARIRANWDTPTALRHFADDVDDATCDLFVATLILASNRRGPGVASAIQGLAESIEAEVRARREVETEQKKPTTAARMITIISTLLLAGLFLAGEHVQPYQTPLGQVLLLGFLSAYLGLLWWMSRLIKTPPVPRFMGTLPTKTVNQP